MEDQNLILQPKIERGYTTLELIVNNSNGIHGRPSVLIAKYCSKYSKKIYAENLDLNSREKIDCTSVLGLLSLGAKKGARVKLYVDGHDEEASKIASEIGGLMVLREDAMLEAYDKNFPR